MSGDWFSPTGVIAGTIEEVHSTGTWYDIRVQINRGNASFARIDSNAAFEF